MGRGMWRAGRQQESCQLVNYVVDLSLHNTVNRNILHILSHYITCEIDDSRSVNILCMRACVRACVLDDQQVLGNETDSWAAVVRKFLLTILTNQLGTLLKYQ